MVGHSHECMERQVLTEERSGPGHRFRCLPDRMGCNLPGPEDRRSVVTPGVTDAHQLPGVAGSNTSNTDIYEGQDTNIRPSQDRQHNTVAYINNRGGTVSKPLVSLAKHLWMWCLERNVHITAQHLPGVLNSVADAESRKMMDRSDWKLNPVIFQRVVDRYGPIEIDLFASRLTTQCRRYFSWRPDPSAEATDAFLQDWSGLRGYANPPWSLIGRVLAQVRSQQARVTLLTPVWKTQPWYPLLLEMLVDHPSLIRDTPWVRVVGDRSQESLDPQLAVWHISGISAEAKSFRRKLPLLSSSRRGLKQIHVDLTTHSLGSGIAGVSTGALIHFQDL